jgi:hypothetical protein
LQDIDVPDLVDNGSPEEIFEVLRALVEDESPEAITKLQEFMLHKADVTFRDIIANLASRALVMKGPAGVEALIDAFLNAPHMAYSVAALTALWEASKGLVPSIRWGLGGAPARPPEPLSKETVDAAFRAVKDLFAEAVITGEYFSQVVLFMQQQHILTEPGRFPAEVVDVLAESTIKLTMSLIREFAEMVTADLPEESYQVFLKDHPVFLDPLASEVFSKQRMGIEHTTDFAVRRFDDRYILVEIEKPQDRIFTQANDFSSQFTHAFGQVIDFQRWVDAHGEYARSLMPRISSPKGMLVMGRRADFDPDNISKLRQYSLNSPHIDIVTFDDLVIAATNLYRNIHYRR